MKVGILYYQLLDRLGERQLVGGVETYLITLARLCADRGWDPVVFQSSEKPFDRELDGFRVIGVPSTGNTARHALHHAAKQALDVTRDLLIFGADHCSVPTDVERSISIQHGVSWDLPTRYFTQRRWCTTGIGASLKKWRLIYSSVQYFRNCPNRVCVDYNFLNWYRTICGQEPDGKIWVVPNFAPIADSRDFESARKSADNVRILFARRFTPYRGTRIMADATLQLIRCRPDVALTFAGEGPDELWLRQRLDGQRQVTFTTYLPDQRLRVHLEHDIAVVPSLGSEGTSLSVAEAMGAGCAVLATGVGGITNMILSEFNGLLVMPTSDDLLRGLQRLVDDPVLRATLGRSAHETAQAFSLGRWRRQWNSILSEVADG